MEAAGLVQEFEDADDERRRFYDLTRSGQRALADELSRLRDVLSAAKRKGMVTPNAVRAHGASR
jgi:DNA-binding MarR family transcriptional regulator